MNENSFPIVAPTLPKESNATESSTAASSSTRIPWVIALWILFLLGLAALFLGIAGPAAGLVVGTTLYVLYHRLGRWPWTDVLATSLVGVPMALAFWLLPGPPSILGVSLAHAGATCGFIGPGPWLLQRLGVLRPPSLR